MISTPNPASAIDALESIADSSLREAARLRQLQMLEQQQQRQRQLLASNRQGLADARSRAETFDSQIDDAVVALRDTIKSVREQYGRFSQGPDARRAVDNAVRALTLLINGQFETADSIKSLEQRVAQMEREQNGPAQDTTSLTSVQIAAIRTRVMPLQLALEANEATPAHEVTPAVLQARAKLREALDKAAAEVEHLKEEHAAIADTTEV